MKICVSLTHIGYFAVTADCSDEALVDLSRSANLMENGWVIDTDSSNQQYDSQCGTKTWFGWRGGYSKGSISTTFKGFGWATLTFSNCYQRGYVDAYLNNDVIGNAQSFHNTTVTFEFSKGNVLTLTESNVAIIKLHELKFNCICKYYSH